MASFELSAVETERLAAEMEAQLRALPIAQGGRIVKGAGEDELAKKRRELEAHWQLVAQVAEEPTDSFLRKFGRVTRRDICEEGGAAESAVEEVSGFE